MKKQILTLLLSFIISNIFSQQLSWEHLKGPMGGIVGDVAINSKGTLFAGIYSYWIWYSGLYKSTDNGNTWEKIEDFEVYSIYITEEDHIWVGTNFQGRIYRSTDDGLTWENKREGYKTGECWAFGKSKDGVMFAGDGQYFNLFRSTNYGDTWELSANLRPLVFATDTVNNIVYAGTHDGLFITRDNGLNWSQNYLLQGFPVSSILFDKDNNIICATGYYDKGNGIFKSTDSGENWTQLGLENKVVLSIAFDSQENLYAGTISEGMYKTTDLGKTWSQYQDGIYKKQVFRLKINKQDDVFVGSENEGIYRLNNGEKTFRQVGLPVSNVKNMDFYADSLIFVSTPSGVQKYNKFSRQWQNMGLTNVYAVDITDNGIMYAATFADGLFKSRDFGKTWELTALTADSIMSVYNVLAVSDDTVFAATEVKLRKSCDGGETWSVLPVRTSFFCRGMFYNGKSLWITGFNGTDYSLYSSTDLTSFKLLFSGLDWVNNNSIFAMIDSTVYLTESSIGTYISKNNGKNWVKIFPGHQVWTIYADEQGLILGGGRDTLWYSVNLGNTWDYLSLGLNEDDNITDIKKDSQNQIYFANYVEGIFKLNIITSASDTENLLPTEFTLYQNYPNPFNPSTAIRYQIPSVDALSPVEVLVTIKVYDILGREVKVLVNGYKSPGNYEVEFDGGNLSSGIYFYKLQAGKYQTVKKMILMR